MGRGQGRGSSKEVGSCEKVSPEKVPRAGVFGGGEGQGSTYVKDGRGFHYCV